MKLRRMAAKKTGPKLPVNGFDMTKVDPTDIVSMELTAAENSLVVRLQVPIGDNEAHAEYEELIDLSLAPGYLSSAAAIFAKAVHRAMRERAFRDRPLPCETCTGACCGRKFSAVCVTEEDVNRMLDGGVDIDKVKLYPEVQWTGYAGEMALVPWEGDEDDLACPFLCKDGCSIYEHRPKICREYSAWTCDMYEEDPEKVDGKVRLRVL